MVRLEDPLDVGGETLPNRLYRAPLLECAGNGPGAVEAFVRELEPAAAAGAGLVFQGATIVREEGGCAAPNMTRVADPEFVARLSELTDRIHEHGARIYIQLEHGGLRSREVWHREYDADEQLAVSRPPWPLRALDRVGMVDLSPRVLSTGEVYDLAADFGRSAGWAADAGYDGIHLAGANMGIIQQFLSPFYNRRDDEFADGVRFLEAIHDEIRKRAGDLPLVTKVPDESAAPAALRPRLSTDDAVGIARRLESIGYDALVPVTTSVFWDASVVRGAFPERAWSDDGFREGYARAFGSRARAALVALGNWLQSRAYDFEPGWNEGLCRRVSAATDLPVLMEGGVRERDQIDRLLGEACDAVGMGRPFYAEPRLPARLLDGGERVACESCNNCVVPQVTGAEGVCRTPSVLRERGRLERAGAYDRGER